MELVLKTVIFAVIGLLVVLAFVGIMIKIFFDRPVERTPEELARLLEGLLTGDESIDMDVALNVPIHDKHLDRIREHCAEIVDAIDDTWRREGWVAGRDQSDRPLPWVSDEGLTVIRSYVHQLQRWESPDPEIC